MLNPFVTLYLVISDYGENLINVILKFDSPKITYLNPKNSLIEGISSYSNSQSHLSSFTWSMRNLLNLCLNFQNKKIYLHQA